MVCSFKPFDYEEGPGGVRVSAVKEPLSHECASDDEIDYVIEAMKTDLDSVGLLMKRMLKQRDGASAFGGPDA